jgi:hypothetical protein
MPKAIQLSPGSREIDLDHCGTTVAAAFWRDHKGFVE